MKKAQRMRKVLVFILAMLMPALAAGQQASYYVLDGFGGVHAGGDAPAIGPPPPFFGFDIARDVAYVPVGRRIGTVDVVGDGVLVLDGFGGVHAGGALPRSMVTPVTPYFGFDVARAITYRNIPPRLSGRAERDIMELFPSANNYVPVATTTIRAPDDGFLLVIASLVANCSSGVSGVTARVFADLGLDSTAAASLTQGESLEDCSTAPYGSIALVNAFPVSAGPHFVHLLARASNQPVNGRVFVYSRSLQVLFVDQDGMGGS